MKVLAILFSLLMFVMLSIEFFQKNGNYHVPSKSLSYNNKLVIPKVLSEKMLSSELKWEKILQDELSVLVPNELVETNKNRFKVGGKSYELFGIFHDDKQLFVLLKNDENEMLKLELGDELSNEFILSEIKNNTIVFVNNNDRVEYKLFEQK